MSAYIIHKLLHTLKSGYSSESKTNNMFAYAEIAKPLKLYEPLGFASGVIEHEFYMNCIRKESLYIILEYGWGENYEDEFVCWIADDSLPIQVEEQVLKDVLIDLHESKFRVGLGQKIRK